ncbi:MAG: type II toxin-antitoxin system HicB family antitoxin [Thermoanaerobaculum sp.]
MKRQFTAVIKEVGGLWVGWIEKVFGVNCQEKTYEELIESLKTALEEALELNRQEALAAAGVGFREKPVTV